MVLGLKDLSTVLDELYDIRDKWYFLGLQLKVPTEKLESLTSHDQDSCFRQVLVDWLKSGTATWLALCQALRHRTVGQDKMAIKLQTKYSAVGEIGSQTIQRADSDVSKGPSSSAATSAAECSSSAQETQQCIMEASLKSQQSSVPIASVSKKEATTSTSAAKKRPSDAPHPSIVKKSKRSIKLPDSFAKKDFIRKPPADRLCVKCDCVPFNPQRSVCCKRLYCEPCSKKNKRCRTHKADLEYTSDKELYSKIQKLKIKCPNRAGGCSWSDTVFNLKNHLPTCGGGGRTSTKDKETAATVSSSHVNKGKKKATINLPVAGHKGDSLSTAVPGIKIETNGAKSADGKQVTITGPSDSQQGIGNTSCPERPPVNMVMKYISEYKTSPGKTWLSPIFLTHQVGYKLRLAVRVSPQPQDGNLQLEIGIVSAGAQEHYLKFPCNGDANVHILNPQENEDHKFIFINNFEINNGASDYYNFASVPERYVHKDCLFFCVEEIYLDDDDCKTWLLDPADREPKDSEEESEESDESEGDSSEVDE